MSYPGGKGRLWRHIVSLMPPHETYVETHLGGGAVMRGKKPAARSFGIDVDPEVIAAAASWKIPGLSLTVSDAVDFLTQYPFDGSELLYCDPPYVAATKKHRRYYRFEYRDADHARLLQILTRLPCKVMISGYPSELYADYLHRWDRRSLQNISHRGPREEIVWGNFAFSPLLHDYRKVGSDFRERERIRRKVSRWLRKLELMPEIERRAVLASIAEVHGPAAVDLSPELRSANA